MSKGGAMSTIRLGISTCLLGEPVRYDGGHKRDRFITDTLGQYVEFVPVCPETECGLGVPRESMRLEGDPASPRLITRRTRVDHTERMVAWGIRRLQELENEDLCGFIFKSDSPSSGMERVRVYSDKGMPQRNGVGIFARMFMERFPLLPVEEEGRLHDLKLRENFVESIFALKRWRDLLKDHPTRGKLVAFHTEHKLLIVSHSPKHNQLMGKLVAEAKELPPAKLYGEYERLFVAALRVKTTVKKNTNVLQHMMGYFKKELSADEKQELIEVINGYYEGLAPLIVPITLLKHYVRKYDQSYLKQQVYLNPHPVELKLRNHV
jgi:uncharacterized protein YbgA (DUF1722 family)/uncharacterized protein YbbK (DUF523 family)